MTTATLPICRQCKHFCLASSDDKVELCGHANSYRGLEIRSTRYHAGIDEIKDNSIHYTIEEARRYEVLCGKNAKHFVPLRDSHGLKA